MKKGEYINSYFIGFEATGVPAIDAILVAIAKAGKAYHSTEYWNDEGLDGGPSHNDLIQEAADKAAATLAGAEPDYEAVADLLDGGIQSGPHGWRMSEARRLVDAALAGRLVIPVPDKETTE